MIRNRKLLGIGELILGILLILLGIFTFIRPTAAMTGAAVIYGLFALISGILDIIYYVRLEQRIGFAPVFSLIGGVLSVLTGILFLFHVTAGSWTLAVLFPVWFIAHCIAGLAHLPFIRLTAGTGYFCFTLIVNILGLVLGFLMVVNPLFSFLTAGYLIGAYLLFLGIDSLVFARNLLCTRR